MKQSKKEMVGKIKLIYPSLVSSIVFIISVVYTALNSHYIIITCSILFGLIYFLCIFSTKFCNVLLKSFYTLFINIIILFLFYIFPIYGRIYYYVHGEKAYPLDGLDFIYIFIEHFKIAVVISIILSVVIAICNIVKHIKNNN